MNEQRKIAKIKACVINQIPREFIKRKHDTPFYERCRVNKEGDLVTDRYKAINGGYTLIIDQNRWVNHG